MFRCKVLGLQTLRILSDVRSRKVKRLGRGVRADYPIIVAQTRSALWTDEALAERAMQLGKVHNLRHACHQLNGTLIPAGSIFSFWKQLGRVTRSKGYVEGRELREGCLIPAVGGGICQLSNALYEVALQAGCPIIERHAHSRVVPGSSAAEGRDATVFWNYVDLRWQAPRDLRLEIRLSGDHLFVLLRGNKHKPAQPAKIQVPGTLSAVLSLPLHDHEPASCMTCGMESCFRHPGAIQLAAGETAGIAQTAFLVDEAWPELIQYVSARASADDVLLVPKVRSGRYRKGAGWHGGDFRAIYEAPLQAIRRGLAVRRLARAGASGGIRREAELRHTALLAGSLGSKLPWNISKVVVAQSFLPFLWLNGDLGGRQFDVLMTRLPLRELHNRLDAAFARHPERSSLRDFRAEPEIVEAEWEALLAANRIVTPHAAIARLFPNKAELLEWNAPLPLSKRGAQGSREPQTIAFPGPTAARKGAFEVREAARELDLEVLLSGSEVEGDDFWMGIRTRRVTLDEAIETAALVVQPSLIEDQPRALLKALANGVAVFSTEACGLPPNEHLALVSTSDPEALVSEIAARLSLAIEHGLESTEAGGEVKLSKGFAQSQS